MNGVFEGAGGAVSLSLIAFSIVFLALIGLTAIIYAIRITAGSKPKPAAKQAVRQQQTVPAAAALPPSAGVSGEVVAAIAGALTAKVNGGFRIVDIKPEQTAPLAANGWVSWGRYDGMQGMDRCPWSTK